MLLIKNLDAFGKSITVCDDDDTIGDLNSCSHLPGSI